MKKKKIKIFSLVILILLATTGVPLSYHLCDAMGKVSSDECEIVCNNCNQQVEEIVSCCSIDEEIAGSVFISSSKSNCCEDEFVFNKLDDEFIFNKSESSNTSFTKNIFTPNSLETNFNNFFYKGIFSADNSPPLKSKVDIHLYNSVLLI
ncbi:MAG: hypothetical protein K6T54_02505 [Ignavibacterium sp.]|nr:hypothetical protein [Ignavibacterium sp.]